MENMNAREEGERFGALCCELFSINAFVIAPLPVGHH